MFLKVHHSPEIGDVVAVCDYELLNTTITGGDLKVTPLGYFYGTTRVDEAAVAEALVKVAISISLGNALSVWP